MTKLFYLLSLLILLTSISIQTKNPNENSVDTDEKTVRKSVISWADSVFYFHEEYRFEQFHAEYTDKYQIARLKLELYLGRQKNLEKIKQKGFYKKTDTEYEKEHSELVKKNADLKTTLDNFQDKAEFYHVLFWSNIKTNQGPTVYYSLLVTLDNNYKVISSEIKSEIGKKNDKTKILYTVDTKKQK